MKEARIYSLAQVGGQCVLVLEEADGPRLLPIWIGLYEGGSIGMSLAGQTFPRPLTHDLFLNALNELKAHVQKVVISNLQDSTFFAEVHVSQEGKSIVMDARPSDSIAIAVRARCPIMINEQVFESCTELLKPITEDEVQDFRQKLETMKPEDFFRDLKKRDDPSDKPDDPPAR